MNAQVYVCMYVVCVCLCLTLCMHVYMHVFVYCLYVRANVRMCVSLYACVGLILLYEWVCVYVCVYDDACVYYVCGRGACVCASMTVCVYDSMDVRIGVCMHAWMNVRPWQSPLHVYVCVIPCVVCVYVSVCDCMGDSIDACM